MSLVVSHVAKLAPRLGGVISGIELLKPLASSAVATIHDALMENGASTLRDGSTRSYNSHGAGVGEHDFEISERWPGRRRGRREVCEYGMAPRRGPWGVGLDLRVRRSEGRCVSLVDPALREELQVAR